MGDDHYLSKIERNTNVVSKASGSIKDECIKDIIWARNLAKGLDRLDYDQRQIAIQKIHDVMDRDYELMGYKKNTDSQENKVTK